MKFLLTLLVTVFVTFGLNAQMPGVPQKPVVDWSAMWYLPLPTKVDSRTELVPTGRDSTQMELYPVTTLDFHCGHWEVRDTVFGSYNVSNADPASRKDWVVTFVSKGAQNVTNAQNCPCGCPAFPVLQQIWKDKKGAVMQMRDGIVRLRYREALPTDPVVTKYLTKQS